MSIWASTMFCCETIKEIEMLDELFFHQQLEGGVL
jgi:hypothetical protein